MKKAILVTGSNGEIGSQLLASMQDSPITKIALDINESITNYDNTIYIKDSITNSENIKKLFNQFKITEVYHFAALLSQTAMNNPQLAKEINEEGSKLIIDTAFESGSINKNFDVLRAENINVDNLSSYNKIILSPGPGLPNEHPILKRIIHKYYASKPILGICLGHQAIAQYFNARIDNLSFVKHGVQSQLKHRNNCYIFDKIPSSSRRFFKF